jgi:hypothetical protein
MQAKTRGLTHTPLIPQLWGDFELAFVVWSKPRVLLPSKLGGWGGHLHSNLNFSKSVHHKHLHAKNDRALRVHGKLTLCHAAHDTLNQREGLAFCCQKVFEPAEKKGLGQRQGD